MWYNQLGTCSWRLVLHSDVVVCEEFRIKILDCIHLVYEHAESNI